MMYAVVDCDNCYVSCERVFRPDLQGKPVVVLSNNDGCVVARSNEAKQFGIKAGMPFFKAREMARNIELVTFSSNYELYAEITGRVMSIISHQAPEFFRYSIDEAFCIFPDNDGFDYKLWGENLHQRIIRSVGMPVSIGIGPTKTIAKMASHFAKKYPGYKHCCVIDTDEKRQKALHLYPLDEVWGIGRRNAAKFRQYGDITAWDVVCHNRNWVRTEFNVNMLRTWSELQGIDCIPDETPQNKKSIMTSRSFANLTSDIGVLKTHVANFAARCAEKLRKQNTVASRVGVFIQTNTFRSDLPQYYNYHEARILTPTASTIDIVKAAHGCLDEIFRTGYLYKRTGVCVQDIVPATSVQTNLIDYNPVQYKKMAQLDEIVDSINRLEGAETVVMGAQQYVGRGGGKATPFSDAMRHDLRSPNPTTRWSDIIKLK